MDNKDLLQQQVAMLSARVSSLEREVFELKKHAGLAKPTNLAQPVATAAQPAEPVATAAQPAQPVATAAQPAEQFRQPDVSPLTQAVCQGEPSPVTHPVTQTHTRDKNLERKLGKNIMGIAAAVLILVSLVLFGGLLLPYITDVVKFVIMYVICIAFSVVGIIFMRNDSKYRTLFSAIAAVGISGFYITDLIGRFSFEILNDFSLLGLIGVWLVATVFLSKFKSQMFSYVSNVGLVVASILMSVNWPEIYIGIIVYFVGLLVLWAINKSRDFLGDFYIFVQIPVMSIVFTLMYGEVWLFIALFALNFLVFGLLSTLYEFDRNIHIPLVIICFCMMIVSEAINVVGLTIGESRNFILFMPLVGIGAFLIWMIREDSRIRQIMWYITFFVMILLYLPAPFADEGICEYIPWYPIAAIALVAFSVVLNDSIFKYAGIFMTFISLCIDLGDGDIAILTVAPLVVGLLVIGFLHFMRTKIYSSIDKYLALVLSIAWVIRTCYELDASFVVYFVLLCGLCIYTGTKKFIVDSDTEETEPLSDVINWAFTAIMMVIGDVCIVNYHDEFTLVGTSFGGEVFAAIIFVMLTMVLCCKNIKRILNSSIPKPLSGIYTCVKFMALLIVILARLEAVSMVITICLLVFAVLCIAAGFKIEIKTCRIYGLVLTLLCVLKLIIFDITYDSMIMRPVGFFIAGALCFGISWGYSRIEKRVSGDGSD